MVARLQGGTMPQTMIGNWVAPEIAGGETARRYAREALSAYKSRVGDIDFGSDVSEGLFVKYLAQHASGADTMRGYWAAFHRK